ncbi:hypothetical protein GCM10011504_22240 [Siccirubricoccus deserti]|uniref:Uncharacterized protein n=1 Tax=Siccirubricoccus deserti TaxID=2013562 RepID=A0A9X0UDG3_9PROT|nr:hypothetical protein [Siccirubricoccus deserti]MBC4015641.1 hypothetical protein [Siccirubricoccus deserti]GGC43384.1 hypothetical protein GCM10011504_22240 [Siccirubricoccus deserti]
MLRAARFAPGMQVLNIATGTDIAADRALPCMLGAIGQALRDSVVRKRALGNGLRPRFEDAVTFGRTMQADCLIWR